MNENEEPSGHDSVTQAVEKRLQEYAMVPKEDREMSLSVYKQVCLFEALNLPKHYIFNNRITLSKDGKRYIMVKRTVPLEASDFVLEDRHDIGGKMPTFSERSGFNASIKNHNHDEILFNAMNCTIDWQELT